MDLAFAYLRERDIDILMVEELAVNAEFAAWYCAMINPNLADARVISVMQSLNTKYDGETDIQLIVDCGGERIGVLIEQKIEAGAQPRQAERYRLRGEAGIAKGSWSRYLTCLSAPQKYIEGPFEAALYDARVSYETLVSYFAAKDDARYRFKAAMVREAIEQNRRGAEATTPHAASTSFFKRYHELVMAQAPELAPDEPRERPSGSRWMVFRPAGWPKSALIRHAMPQKRVCLYLKAQGDDVLIMAGLLRPLLEDDMRLSWVKCSVTVDIETPPILPSAEDVAFESHVPGLELSIRHAQRLRRLYEKLRQLPR